MSSHLCLSCDHKPHKGMCGEIITWQWHGRTHTQRCQCMEPNNARPDLEPDE